MYHTPSRIRSDYKIATANDAVDALVRQAKALGANGIINLKIHLSKGDNNRTIYYADGMAIIR